MEQHVFGTFLEDGKVYRVEMPETPRPLMNYLWNRRFLSAVNHFGGGDGAYGGRTAYYIDPDNRGRATLIRNGNRYFYIREEDGELWNPGWYPVCHELDTYYCDHTPGSTTVCGSSHNLEVKAEVFVPEEETCEIWTITLCNRGENERRAKLYSFVEFSLEGYSRYSEYDSYVEASYEKDSYMVYARNNAQERPHEWYDGFIASDCRPDGYETSKRRFLGVYGSIAQPQALLGDGALGNCRTACEDMAGVLCHEICLNAGETRQIHIFIGSSDSRERAVKICQRLRNADIKQMREETVQRCLERAKTSWIHSPYTRLNAVYNYWVKQQVAMCAEVGRSTGKGFRDTLQDSMALCAFNPQLAKEKLLETLRHQYSDGRCPRGWLPVDSHIYSDGPVWIAPAINGYLKETGDFEILQEVVPYLDQGEATVWEHVLLSVRYPSADLGAHGLVLAHDGDWNDSLNGIGVKGKGESVWTSIALYGALGDVIEMAQRFYPEEALLKELEQLRVKIGDAVCSQGWDGEWFLAGYDDEGRPVGSHKEQEGKIYLNPQTWAILTGVAKPEQIQPCREAVRKYLDCENGALTLYPPYTSYNPSIGRLTGFVPGIWENGAPYCHGGMFKVVSDFAAKQPQEGMRTLLRILPDSPDNPSVQSGCEPYVFTNMYLGPDNPRAGATSFAWVTGTAGWAQRAVSEYLFGFKPGYEEFRIDPVLPEEFRETTLIRRFRNVLYHIQYHRGEKKLVVDGTERSFGEPIPVFEDGGEHMIEVICP